jgi:hypothetical protein
MIFAQLTIGNLGGSTGEHPSVLSSPHAGGAALPHALG